MRTAKAGEEICQMDLSLKIDGPIYRVGKFRVENGIIHMNFGWLALVFQYALDRKDDDWH